MKTYRLSPQFHSILKRRLLIVVLPIMVMAGGVPVGYYLLQTNSHVLNTGPVVVILIIAVLAFSLWNAWHRQRKSWDSYRLTVTDETITREQAGFQTLSIT